MTITLTISEVALLTEVTARKFADCINCPSIAKEYATRLRELLDTYDTLRAKEKAECDERRDKACWP